MHKHRGKQTGITFSWGQITINAVYSGTMAVKMSVETWLWTVIWPHILKSLFWPVHLPLVTDSFTTIIKKWHNLHCHDWKMTIHYTIPLSIKYLTGYIISLNYSKIRTYHSIFLMVTGLITSLNHSSLDQAISWRYAKLIMLFGRCTARACANKCAHGS